MISGYYLYIKHGFEMMFEFFNTVAPNGLDQQIDCSLHPSKQMDRARLPN